MSKLVIREEQFGNRHRAAVDPYRPHRGEERIAVVRPGPRAGIKTVDFFFSRVNKAKKTTSKKTKSVSSKEIARTADLRKRQEQQTEAARAARKEHIKQLIKADLARKAEGPPPRPRVAATGESPIANLFGPRKLKKTTPETRVVIKKPELKETTPETAPESPVDTEKRVNLEWDEFTNLLAAESRVILPKALKAIGFTSWSLRCAGFDNVFSDDTDCPKIVPFGTNEGFDFSSLSR